MLRGGVVGLGRMGITHFCILNNHPEVEFVAVCDSSAFLLKEDPETPEFSKGWNIRSIVFGACSRAHIQQTGETIDEVWASHEERSPEAANDAER